MNKNKKIKTYILISINLTILYLLVCFLFYKNNLNKFKEYINSENYMEANNILTNKHLNLINTLKLKNTCNDILNEHLDQLNNNYLSNNISQESLLLKLTTLENLNLNTTQTTTIKKNLPLISSSNEAYSKAVSLFNDKNYEESLNSFNEISSFYPNYSEILDYKKQCIDVLKSEIFNKVNNLIENNAFSEAITIIEDSLKKLDYNIELLNKLEEIKKLRMNYLEEYSEDSINSNANSAQAMSSFYNKLDSSTINTFDIDSKTDKLVFVNISEQKTYIYTGNSNNWQLEKEFVCSTGIENKETPIGIFEVQTRAPWFFASKYGQGGKYYVQFMGNYLFHSIPFAEDQETILDETLGEPASHGCIRLDTEDAKWLYDNVLDGSKIIIY